MKNCEKFQNSHTFTNIENTAKDRFEDKIKPDIYFYLWDNIDTNQKPTDYVFTNTNSASLIEEKSNTEYLVNLHVPFHQDSFDEAPWFLFYVIQSDGHIFHMKEGEHVHTFPVETGEMFVFNSLDAHSLELSDEGKKMLEQYINEPTVQNRDMLSEFLFHGAVISLPHKPSYEEALNLFQELDLSLENNNTMRP